MLNPAPKSTRSHTYSGRRLTIWPAEPGDKDDSLACLPSWSLLIRCSKRKFLCTELQGLPVSTRLVNGNAKCRRESEGECALSHFEIHVVLERAQFPVVVPDQSERKLT